MIDNCQHVLLRCCVNLLDLYNRLGVGNKIRFHREFFFIEPGGRTSILKRGMFPGARAFLRIVHQAEVPHGRRTNSPSRAPSTQFRVERLSRSDLDKITMLDWLHEKRQTEGAIDRYWRQVLVSAVNEELDRMAAAHGFQVFWLGMIARADSYEMGIPDVPLRELYDESACRVEHRSAVTSIEIAGGSRMLAPDRPRARHRRLLHFRVALRTPPAAASRSSGRMGSSSNILHNRNPSLVRSPRDGLPHATLLDRTIQWMFNKSEGRYIQVVVSASRSLLETPRNEIIDLAMRELAEFFPPSKKRDWRKRR